MKNSSTHGVRVDAVICQSGLFTPLINEKEGVLIRITVLLKKQELVGDSQEEKQPLSKLGGPALQCGKAALGSRKVLSGVWPSSFGSFSLQTLTRLGENTRDNKATTFEKPAVCRTCWRTKSVHKDSSQTLGEEQAVLGMEQGRTGTREPRLTARSLQPTDQSTISHLLTVSY